MLSQGVWWCLETVLVPCPGEGCCRPTWGLVRTEGTLLWPQPDVPVGWVLRKVVRLKQRGHEGSLSGKWTLGPRLSHTAWTQLSLQVKYMSQSGLELLSGLSVGVPQGSGQENTSDKGKRRGKCCCSSPRHPICSFSFITEPQVNWGSRMPNYQLHFSNSPAHCVIVQVSSEHEIQEEVGRFSGISFKVWPKLLFFSGLHFAARKVYVMAKAPAVIFYCVPPPVCLTFY